MGIEFKNLSKMDEDIYEHKLKAFHLLSYHWARYSVQNSCPKDEILNKIQEIMTEYNSWFDKNIPM